MKIGDYVRTKYGITQYREYDTTNGKLLCMPIHDMTQGFFANLQDIIKTSPNIIDLIEVGDYVNGLLVVEYYEENKCFICECCGMECGESWIYENDDIKSIVTKEQFESMEYKINKKDLAQG